MGEEEAEEECRRGRSVDAPSSMHLIEKDAGGCRGLSSVPIAMHPMEEDAGGYRSLSSVSIALPLLTTRSRVEVVAGASRVCTPGSGCRSGQTK